MVLFFESRHASLLVEAFCLNWASDLWYHSMRRAATRTAYTSSGRVRHAGMRAGLSGHPKLVREPFGTHERRARLWAAFAIYFSRTEHTHHDPGLPVQR